MDLAREFSGQAELTAFTSTVIPLLAEARHLAGKPLAEAAYYEQAHQIQQQIVHLG